MFVQFSFVILLTFFFCIHIKILQKLSFKLTTPKEMLNVFRIDVAKYAFFIFFSVEFATVV